MGTTQSTLYNCGHLLPSYNHFSNKNSLANRSNLLSFYFIYVTYHYSNPNPKIHQKLHKMYLSSPPPFGRRWRWVLDPYHSLHLNQKNMSDNLLLYISSIICALLTIYQIFNRQKRAGILSAITHLQLLPKGGGIITPICYNTIPTSLFKPSSLREELEVGISYA